MSTTPSDQRPGDSWLGNAYHEEYTKTQPTLPTMLNVLTILTFVGSAFGFLSAFGSFLIAPFGYQSARNSAAMTDQMSNQMPAFFKSMMGNGVEAARLAYTYRVPILLLALVGVLCCFFGALLMRKLKKTGFYLYTVGELLPLANLIFFSSFSLFTGIAYGFSFAIILTFIILYATQLKYLK